MKDIQIFLPFAFWLDSYESVEIPALPS